MKREAFDDIKKAQPLDEQIILVGWLDSRFEIVTYSHGEVLRWDNNATIGSGMVLGNVSLNMREHKWSHGLEETVYMVYEAHVFGLLAPGVGNRGDIAVLRYDKETNSIMKRSVSRSGGQALLKEYNEKYGPRKLGVVRLPSEAFESFEQPLISRVIPRGQMTGQHDNDETEEPTDRA